MAQDGSIIRAAGTEAPTSICGSTALSDDEVSTEVSYVPDGADADWTVDAIRVALDDLEMAPWAVGAVVHEPARRIERAADRLGAEDLRMRALLVQADVQARLGQTVATARIARQVNRWAFERSPQQRHLQARSHRLLASFFDGLGDFPAFLEHAMQAVDLMDDTTPLRVRIDHEMLLAIAQGRIPRLLDQAREGFAAVEAMTITAGRLDLRIAAVNNVAYAEYQAGETEAALAQVDRLVELVGRHGVPVSLPYLDTIASVQLAAGRFTESIETLRAVREQYLPLDSAMPASLPECLLTLAQALHQHGEYEEAERTLTRCSQLARHQGLDGILVRVTRVRSELAASRGEFDVAYELLKEYVEGARAQASAEVDARAGMLQAVFDTQQAQQQSRRFRDLALRDPLTGLFNRRHVDDQLPSMLVMNAEDGRPVSVAFVDLDHFKRVNDECSHAVGDQVLRAVARILTDAVGAAGFVARMGGEEFLMVLPDMAVGSTVSFCEQVQEALRSRDWTPLTGSVPVRASIGVASTGEHVGSTQAELLGHADRCVYRAKAGGRDRVVW